MKEIVDKEVEALTEIEEDFSKKLAKTNFMKRLSPYNKPKCNVVIGIILSCV